MTPVVIRPLRPYDRSSGVSLACHRPTEARVVAACSPYIPPIHPTFGPVGGTGKPVRKPAWDKDPQITTRPSAHNAGSIPVRPTS